MTVSCFAFRLTAYPGGGSCKYFRSVSYFSLFTSGLWWRRLEITGSRTLAVIEQPSAEHQSWYPLSQTYSRLRCWLELEATCQRDNDSAHAAAEAAAVPAVACLGTRGLPSQAELLPSAFRHCISSRL